MQQGLLSGTFYVSLWICQIQLFLASCFYFNWKVFVLRMASQCPWVQRCNLLTKLSVCLCNTSSFTSAKSYWSGYTIPHIPHVPNWMNWQPIFVTTSDHWNWVWIQKYCANVKHSIENVELVQTPLHSKCQRCCNNKIFVTQDYLLFCCGWV